MGPLMDLAKRTTVTELVGAYQQAAANIREGYRLVHEAEVALNKAFTTEGSVTGLYIRDRSNFRGHFNDPTPVLDNLKRDTWRILVDRLDIKRALSNKAKKQLDEQLERGELPEITVEEVLGFAQMYIENLPRLLEEAVKEVFNMLRPRSTWGKKYKTNTEFEIGWRVILSRIIEEPRWSNNYMVNYRKTQELTALENVFSALDGKGQMTKGWQSDLQMAIEKLPHSGNGRGETEYFRFRACKNGNLHLEFKRMDLVKRLNEVAGGKNLKTKDDRCM